MSPFRHLRSTADSREECDERQRRRVEEDLPPEPLVPSLAKSMPFSPLSVTTVLVTLAVSVTSFMGLPYAVLLSAVAALLVPLALWSQGDKPEAGSEKADEYELLDKLGEGGMGEVFRARQAGLGRLVALKRIKTLVRSEEHSARFKREARTLSSLFSPHTINVFDAGVQSDGSYYYVMELLDGLNLSQLIEKSGPLPAGRVIHVLRQACLSLIEAHDAGLVHRDVKPENIMLCRYGGEYDFVKLLDFGLVKLVEEDVESAGPITRAGAMPGTPAFIAPESVLGGDFVDSRADIYSLGAIGFYLLTARFLFDADSPLAMVQAHRHQAPPRAQDISGTDVPRALDDLLACCLEKNPEHRYQTAALLLCELEKLAIEYPWTRAQAEKCWADVAPVSLRPPPYLSSDRPGEFPA